MAENALSSLDGRTQAYIHPDPQQTLLPVLAGYLPYSLPLYRRLQAPFLSPHAYVLATFPPYPQLLSSNKANVTPAEQTHQTAEEVKDGGQQCTASNEFQSRVSIRARLAEQFSVPTCFASCFIDRSRQPETEMWCFQTSEAPGQCCSSSSISAFSGPSATTAVEDNGSHSDTEGHAVSQQRQQQTCQSCDEKLLALLAHIRSLPRPAVEDPTGISGNKNTVKLGTATRLALSALEQARCLDESNANNKIVYQKFIFANCVGQNTKSSSSSSMRAAQEQTDKVTVEAAVAWRKGYDLPPSLSLSWGTLSLHSHFSLVVSRTSIPRRESTLQIMENVAVYDTSSNNDMPIAWALLNLDGGIASLHVEPAYRGLGIAQAVMRRLLEKFVPTLDVWGIKDGLSHADVAVENKQSEGVCRAVGAREGWDVFWLSIDLDKITGLHV